MHAPVTLYLYMTHTPWHPLSLCTRSPSSSYSSPPVSFHPSQLHCICPSSTAPLPLRPLSAFPPPAQTGPLPYHYSFFLWLHPPPPPKTPPFHHSLHSPSPNYSYPTQTPRLPIFQNNSSKFPLSSLPQHRYSLLYPSHILLQQRPSPVLPTA